MAHQFKLLAVGGSLHFSHSLTELWVEAKMLLSMTSAKRVYGLDWLLEANIPHYFQLDEDADEIYLILPDDNDALMYVLAYGYMREYGTTISDT